jgi:hypothetical protein
MLHRAEDFFHKHLHQLPLFEQHMAHPISLRITTVALLGLMMIAVYKLAHHFGTTMGLWSHGLNEHVPEHCAHAKVDCSVRQQGETRGELQYKVEFSPEEYSKKEPELGAELGFLRRKVYFLVKDSDLYHAISSPHFTIDDVQLYYKGKPLTQNSMPLIRLGVETGCKVDAIIELSR